MEDGTAIGDEYELIDRLDCWNQWSPRETLCPEFLTDSAGGGVTLGIAGGGNPYGFGWWSRRVPAQSGTTYRFRARLRLIGIDDPNLRVLTAVAWRRGDTAMSNCPQDYLSAYQQDREGSDLVTVEEVLRAPDSTTSTELLLLLRGAPRGTVWWESVTMEEVPALSPRRATVTVVQGRPPAPATADSSLTFWATVLEQATASDPDLVCLPECMNSAGRDLTDQDAAEPLFGRTFELLTQHARRLNAYVCGCFYERNDDFVFNTAVLLDRAGRYVGCYRKIHPYWPEMPQGVSPGDDLPVFRTDFGTVGIMICYDSWFGETARALALKGAELILFPNAGHDPKILPARAIDNGLYIANASLNCPATVIDTLGERLVETVTHGVASTTVDLAYRPSPHPNAGGRLNASPAGQRALRNAISDRLLRELLADTRRLEVDGTGSYVA